MPLPFEQPFKSEAEFLQYVHMKNPPLPNSLAVTAFCYPRQGVPGEPPFHKMTILEAAAAYDVHWLIRTTLTTEALIGRADRDPNLYEPPLILAVRLGHTATVSAMLQHMPDNFDWFSQLTHRHCNALHIAARAGHVEIIKLLLTHQVVRENIDALDGQEQTALGHAAWNQRIEAVSLLVAAGALDSHEVLSTKTSPFMLASWHSNISLLMAFAGDEAPLKATREKRAYKEYAQELQLLLRKVFYLYWLLIENLLFQRKTKNMPVLLQTIELISKNPILNCIPFGYQFSEAHRLLSNDLTHQDNEQKTNDIKIESFRRHICKAMETLRIQDEALLLFKRDANNNWSMLLNQLARLLCNEVMKSDFFTAYITDRNRIESFARLYFPRLTHVLESEPHSFDLSCFLIGLFQLRITTRHLKNNKETFIQMLSTNVLETTVSEGTEEKANLSSQSMKQLKSRIGTQWPVLVIEASDQLSSMLALIKKLPFMSQISLALNGTKNMLICAFPTRFMCPPKPSEKDLQALELDPQQINLILYFFKKRKDTTQRLHIPLHLINVFSQEEFAIARILQDAIINKTLQLNAVAAQKKKLLKMKWEVFLNTTELQQMKVSYDETLQEAARLEEQKKAREQEKAEATKNEIAAKAKERMEAEGKEKAERDKKSAEGITQEKAVSAPEKTAKSAKIKKTRRAPAVTATKSAQVRASLDQETHQRGVALKEMLTQLLTLSKPKNKKNLKNDAMFYLYLLRILDEFLKISSKNAHFQEQLFHYFDQNSLLFLYHLLQDPTLKQADFLINDLFPKIKAQLSVFINHITLSPSTTKEPTCLVFLTDAPALPEIDVIAAHAIISAQEISANAWMSNTETLPFTLFTLHTYRFLIHCDAILAVYAPITNDQGVQKWFQSFNSNQEKKIDFLKTLLLKHSLTAEEQKELHSLATVITALQPKEQTPVPVERTEGITVADTDLIDDTTSTSTPEDDRSIADDAFTSRTVEMSTEIQKAATAQDLLIASKLIGIIAGLAQMGTYLREIGALFAEWRNEQDGPNDPQDEGDADIVAAVITRRVVWGATQNVLATETTAKVPEQRDNERVMRCRMRHA